MNILSYRDVIYMINNKLITNAALASVFLVSALPATEQGNLESPLEKLMRDSVITIQIKSRLIEAKDIHSLNIQVNTDNNGIVVLTGAVKSKAEKDRALYIAYSVEGVKQVFNRLKIHPDSEIHSYPPKPEIYRAPSPPNSPYQQVKRIFYAKAEINI